MKTYKKPLHHFIFCILMTIGFLNLVNTVTAQTGLQKAIKKHIEKTQEDASEYKEARKIVFGDVDGNGVKDAVVQYTLEGAGGGNSWGQYLVVFLKKKGVFKEAAEAVVGGKFFRSFNLLKVVNKEIVGATETCPEDGQQGLCKNPKRKQTKFILINGNLREK